MTSVLVIAKAPLPGRAKTRLVPPCTNEEAAAIAEASLRNTAEAVSALPGVDPVLVLDGPFGPWVPSGWTVVPQHGAGLDERLESAFADVEHPAVLIGMDTPQVTAEILAQVIATLDAPSVDAVIGTAVDGGWWTAGLTTRVAGAFAGVPMSTPHTARAQRARFASLGLRVAEVGRLRDVDTFEDALAVADLVPGSPFAAAVDAVKAQDEAYA